MVAWSASGGMTALDIACYGPKDRKLLGRSRARSAAAGMSAAASGNIVQSVIMGQQRCDAAEAFAVLRLASQRPGLPVTRSPAGALSTPHSPG